MEVSKTNILNRIVKLVILTFLGLSIVSCSDDAISFSIHNPTTKDILVKVDEESLVIPTNSSYDITLKAGRHKIYTDAIGERSFVTYINNIPKKSVINPTLNDYVVFAQPYLKHEVLKEQGSEKTAYVKKPIKEINALSLEFQYLSDYLFIDAYSNYSLSEELPNVVFEDGASIYPTIKKTKIFPLEDFINYVGKPYYNKYLAKKMHKLGKPKHKVYTTKNDVLGLVPKIDSPELQKKYYPLIALGKGYLNAETAENQKEISKQITEQMVLTVNQFNSNNKKELTINSEVMEFISQAYKGVREVSDNDVLPENVVASNTFKIETNTPVNSSNTKIWVFGGVLGLLGLFWLYKYVSKKLLSSSIQWYDEASFDSSSRNFGLAAASVYDNGIRIDAYKDITNQDIRNGKDILQSAWSTTNKQELLETLEGLRTDTHRSAHDRVASHVNTLNTDEFEAYVKSLEDDYDQNQARLLYKNETYTSKAFMAWDLLRFFFIAHSGVLAKHITIEEFEEFSNPVIRKVRKHYKGWDDFFNHFLLGRNVWKGEESSVSIKIFQNRVKDLLESKNSPCRKVDWNCPITVLPEQEIVIMEDQKFWELIATANTTGLATFLPRLEGALTQLSDEDIFSFKAKLDSIIETFGNPVYHYGAMLLLTNEVSPYLLLVWLIYRGEEHYKEFLRTPDTMLSKEVSIFMEANQKEEGFFQILQENIRLFSVTDAIIANRKLNPLFKTLTYEERCAIYDNSLRAMPITENPYPNLEKELSSWSS